MTTPKIGMPELTAGQSGKELTHNEALSIIDQRLQERVIDKDLSTPPGSPADGAAYIVGSSPTGAWVGHAGKVAHWRASAAAWKFSAPSAGWAVWVTDEAVRYLYTGSAWKPEYISIGLACSDEATAIVAGTSKLTFRMPYAFTLKEVRASLTTAQTSGSVLTVDINEEGASILSTKLTIDNTEKSSKTAATAAVISDSALADDAEITVDVDIVGNGTATGLKVWLIGVIA